MSDTLDEARAALRQRQGAGARYDADNAPARELDWARRGTAYFARLLNGLSDADLDAPSRLDGLSRCHIVAHVGYHARTLSRVASWARHGAGQPMPHPMPVDADDTAARATQPARALRNLFAHSAVHLNVEWRDLETTHWDAVVTDNEGHSLAVRDTPWLRARAVWLHAIDLGAGGRLADAPTGLAARLPQKRTAMLMNL
ncbi:MAG: maleylpyruvate isomerase N-terminal domain-containing protein [Roseitalea sp.]|jgi:maleylpyruvate isomerase|nr:maleylpyruvate isomerase N-terminal domain-containing protein [Roseitalea sp.]MBO6720389.1 maleylpyruvate isomerase N-terminal domain-containing protein [Roseitalea sp.]MBO6742749.1 maleylpyruvate isomerase N-terminal domain-containing protein [Roseitalea sp.]